MNKKTEELQTIAALTKTELAILAAAKDGATSDEICAAVLGSPDYIKNVLPRLVEAGYLEKQPMTWRARVKVEVRQ